MGPGLVARGPARLMVLTSGLFYLLRQGGPMAARRIKNGSLFLQNGTILHPGTLFRDNRTGDRNAGQVSLDMHHMDHVSQNNYLHSCGH